MTDNNKNEIKEEPKTFLIKFGLITQSTPMINTLKLFKDYFDFISSNNYIIKSEISYSFNPEDIPGVNLTYHKIREIKKLNEYFKEFNAFIIMVDLTREEVVNECEFFVDSLLEASDYNLRKVYIFAFYKDD
ncbi:MAG: hypothetical protein MJ252_13275, partial [archaeon]|nr:hypothetical protein [archaeon]